MKGVAAGGVRIAPGLALAEVKILAGEMTKKSLFTGLPRRGGAKGGICLSEDHIDNDEKRRHILTQFGDMIGRLVRERRYLPAVDMGDKTPAETAFHGKRFHGRAMTMFYRFSRIEFHKAGGRSQSKSYFFSASSRFPTDNEVKFGIWKPISSICVRGETYDRP